MVLITQGNPLGSKVDGSEIEITSEAQGDILYRGASNWTRLAAGTSGQFLKTLGAAANPAWAGAGNIQLIQRQVVSGGAVTTVTFSSLDIDTDGYYLLLWNIKAASGSNSVFKLYVNADTTDANYSTQAIQAQDTSIAAARTANPLIAEADPSTDLSGFTWVFLDAGDNFCFNSITNSNQGGSGASATSRQYCGLKVSATETNITELAITCGTASGIANDSEIALYKVTIV